MPSKVRLIDMVSSKIDEVLPPGENFDSIDVAEGPVNYIDVEIDEAAKYILRHAPINLVMQMIKNADKHFPTNPLPITGLLEMGSLSSNSGVLSLSSVEYQINSVKFGPFAFLTVDEPDNPGAGNSRRDIVAINTEGDLVFILGQESPNAELIDFPSLPANHALVAKVINIDGQVTYFPEDVLAQDNNPNVRLIYNHFTGISIIPLPCDFLRFVSLKLDRWLYPVNFLIDQQSQAYTNQKTKRFTMGTENKPVAALVSFTEYIPEEISVTFQNKKQAIECFTTKDKPTIQHLHYIPEVLPEKFPSDLVDVMVWESAARVLVKMKYYEQAQAVRNEVQMFFSNQIGVM